MRRPRSFYVYGAIALALLVGLVGVPAVVKNRYFIHILIMTYMYIALALSYDLVVGHVGLLSLAHPTFFGVGAYAAALLSTRFGAPFWATFALGAIVAAGLAFLASFPFFRLAGVSFSIGTLGFALIMQLVANNEIWLTNGPMCLTGVSRPRLTIPPLLDWRVSSVADYYYLVLGMLIIVVALCSRLTTSRVGRAFIAIREDEILAMASAVNVLKYKTLAFVIGALIAGSLGAYYAHYSTLVCPSDLSNYMTTILLIVLFVGGVGTMRGVILGGILFTVIPEILRITPQFRMLIYGVLLLVVIVYVPDGLEGSLTRWLGKSRLSSTRATSGEDKHG
jgi:ABC-type branched-subunit amino acid transport system permease subunit